MADLFLEVRCEEIPARMLPKGIGDLSTRLFEELMGRNLAPSEVVTGFTPRRLALTMRGLPGGEADREEFLTGPPISAAYDSEGEPTKALLGFAARCGVDPEQVETVETDKGEYVGATRFVAGVSTLNVLSEVLPRLLADMAWPKSMRWGASEGPWVRPVHSIVSLLDGQLVPFELFGIASGTKTIGHPVLSPESFEVGDSESYYRCLAERGILVDFKERRAQLLEGLDSSAQEVGGRLVEDSALLDKLAAICEIPGVVRGAIEHMDLPREVLITSLRDHQSAFTVEAEGELLPWFLTVMDREDDQEGRVQRGNEWVVAARLEDARFFYGEDRKMPLTERGEDLDRLTFHERLGSYADKTRLNVSLVESLCRSLGREDLLEECREAATLLKSDLTTELVKEFTSLQGIMGGVYAREQGHDEGVWQAIYDQYRPASTSDPIPRGAVGQIASLADRLTTLVGMFGLGLIPTGSKDPFGLRRSAQGAVRIIIEGEFRIDLHSLVRQAIELYGDRLEVEPETILSKLTPFFEDRARYVLGLEGFAYDEIEAALAIGGADFTDLRNRVAALHEVRETPGFLDVVLAAKRIENILRKSDEAGEFSVERMQEPAEKALYEGSVELERFLDQTAVHGDHVAALSRIADFAGLLDEFFVDVLVMDPDAGVRANRLALLESIHSTLSRTAQLTEMVVDRAEHRKKS